CTQCGRTNNQRTKTDSDSRLIEFPRQTRSEPGKSAPQLPAWRAELSEKVKEIRAKKQAAASPSDPLAYPGQSVEGRQSGFAGTSQERDQTPNPTVEAALARVRRASVGVSYDSKGVAPQRGGGGGLKPPVMREVMREVRREVMRDRAATATALDPIVEPLRVQTPALPELARTVEPHRTTVRPPSRETKSSDISTAPTAPRARQTPAIGAGQIGVNAAPAPASIVAEPSISKTAGSKTAGSSGSPRYATAVVATKAIAADFDLDDEQGGPIDEIEPLDYLEAEVRKVDEKLLKQEALDRAPHFCRVVSGAIDALTVLISAVPFVGLILFSGGRLSATHTQIAAGAVVLLIALFYLALTQSLIGKTFGMMVTNTRVVEGGTHSSPSLSRVLIRSVCYLISIAPAAAGLLWMFLDGKGRAWHDLLSGTVVIRDF
ncbi:MAG: RDD family protein, partial [Blastocatellia bacterium]